MFKKNSIKQYEPVIKVALIIISASLLIFFCLQNYKFFFDLFYKILDILQPILYGLVLAYLASPICRNLESFFKKELSKKIPSAKASKYAKNLGVFLSLLFFIFLILAMIMLIIPQLFDSINNFIEKYPSYIQHSQTEIYNFLRKVTDTESRQQILMIWNEVSDYINQYFSNTILPNLASMVNSFSGTIVGVARSLFNFLIGFIVAIYCLDKRRVFGLQFKKLLFAFFPEKVAAEVIMRAKTANHVFLNFLVGKIIDSIIIGIICFVGAVILKLPYPLLIAIIIGVTNIIPFFGPFLGAIPCTILILLENPLQALYFIIFIFILQQFDGNILGPKILGDTTGISSFWVLFSILLFGGLWGVAGMIIAVPLFVVIYNIVKEITNDKLESKGLPTAAYEYEDENTIKAIEQKKKEAQS